MNSKMKNQIIQNIWKRVISIRMLYKLGLNKDKKFINKISILKLIDLQHLSQNYWLNQKQLNY